jgi:hypothetical protein
MAIRSSGQVFDARKSCLWCDLQTYQDHFLLQGTRRNRQLLVPIVLNLILLFLQASIEIIYIRRETYIYFLYLNNAETEGKLVMSDK